MHPAVADVEIVMHESYQQKWGICWKTFLLSVYLSACMPIWQLFCISTCLSICYSCMPRCLWFLCESVSRLLLDEPSPLLFLFVSPPVCHVLCLWVHACMCKSKYTSMSHVCIFACISIVSVCMGAHWWLGGSESGAATSECGVSCLVSLPKPHSSVYLYDLQYLARKPS